MIAALLVGAALPACDDGRVATRHSTTTAPSARSAEQAASAHYSEHSPDPASSNSTDSAATRTAEPSAAACVRHPWVDPAERSTPRRRLVSTAPLITEICCALGVGDQLVGRSRFCEYPPEILPTPSIGGLLDMSAEFLVSLRPDVVLVAGRSPAVVDRLEQMQLRYVSLADFTLADVYRAIERVGALVERPRTAATLVRRLRRDIAACAPAANGTIAPEGPGQRGPARRVLIVIGTISDPPSAPFVAAAGSFYDDLLRLAGHQNAAPAGLRPFAPLAIEAVIEARPDVIIELDPDGQQRPGGAAQALTIWRKIRPELPACATGRVHVLVGGEHYLLGPRIAETCAALSALIAR